MSTDGLQNLWIPPTLDGLNIVDADQLYIDGQQVDLTSLVPYTGATRLLDMGGENIRTSHVATSGNDVVNKTKLDATVDYLAIAISGTFLNKTTATEQIVVAPTTFNSTVTANYFYTNNSLNWSRPSASYNAWSIGRVANGGVIKDLQFKDDTSNQPSILLSSTGQTVYTALICDYGTASKIPVWDANKKLVSSGTDSSKLSFLDNVVSDIQNQINSKLSLSGGVMTGQITMNNNRITSTYSPLASSDLTNKFYVDSAISGVIGTNYVLRAGDSMTGNLLMGSNAVQSAANPVAIDDLCRKGYVDGQDSSLQTQINTKANTADLDNYLTLSSAASTYATITALNLKADQTALANYLTLSSAASTYATITALNLKADQTALANYLTLSSAASTYATITALNLKADQTALANYLTLSSAASTYATITALNLKADQTALANYLTLSSAASTYATISSLTSGLNLKMNLVGGNTITGPQFYSDAVASRVAVFDGYRGLTYGSVSTTTLAYLDVTSSVQTQLNSKANSSLLSNYLPLTGGVLTGDLNLSTLTAGKALYIDGSKNIRTSTTTSTELSYLTNVTSPIQSQINVLSASRPLFPRRDDKRTGLAPSNQEAESLSYWFGTFANGTGTFADLISMNSWADSSGGAVNMIAFNRGDKGIRQFQGTYGSTTNFSTYYDCVMTDANSSNVGITGTLSVGLASNITPNIKFANSLNHITGNASEAYLFNGTNGYIAVGRNTTRSSTEANLHMGTLGTDCSIESIASNGSKYLPMGYYASSHYFTGGSVGIGTTNPVTLLTIAGSVTTNADYKLMVSFVNTQPGYYDWQVGPQTIDGQAVFSIRGGADSTSDLSNMLNIHGGGNVGIGITNPSTKLTVDGAGLFYGSLGAYKNGTGGPSAIYSENPNAGDAYAVMFLRNNTGSGCYWFLNSSGRPSDGGPNTTTLRNDIGALRLQSNGGNGIMIASTSGYVGIGTTNPGNQFYNYSANTSGWAGWAYCGNSNTGVVIGTYNNEAYLGGHNGALNAWTSVNLCPSGNLGIGAIDNSYKVNVAGKIKIESGATSDPFITLKAPSSTGGDQIRISFSHAGNGNFIESYRVFGLNRAVLRFFATNATLNSIEMFNISDSGITCFGNFYTASSAWCGSVSTLGNGCSTFSQGYDRWLCYANGSNTGGGYAYYNQAGALGTISDRRIKKDFQAITEDQSITFIKALEPTSFCLKEQETCIRTTTDKDGNEIEEKIYPSVCGCRQDGWIAQNVLEACELSGVPKSVVNHWYDYEQELEKPEEERTTLIGVSDRPILSHTVNVVKLLLGKVETLTQRNLDLEKAFLDYKRLTDERFNKLTELLLQK